MTAFVLMGSLSWGIGIGLLFLYLVERDARLVVHAQARWPFIRWFRPLAVAVLVFAPAFFDGIATMGSLVGFIVGRTLFLACWTRTTKRKSPS